MVLAVLCKEDTDIVRASVCHVPNTHDLRTLIKPEIEYENENEVRNLR